MNNSQRSGAPVAWIVFVFVLVIVGVLCRPWWHDPLLLVANNWPIWIFVVTTVAVVVWAFNACKDSFHAAPVLLAALLLLTTLVYAGTASSLLWAKVGNEVNYQTVDKLPTTSEARLLPLQVASRYGVDALQEPTQQLNEWQPQTWNGHFSFVAARVPDGFWRRVVGRTTGLMAIDASQTAKNSKYVDCTMEVSEGVAFGRNIRWAIYAREYWCDLPEVFYGQDAKHQIVAVVPVIRYRGWPIRTPYFAGVYKVDPEGQLERLSVSQAQQDPQIVSTGRLFPEKLARLYADAYGYRHGVWNAWFVHQNQSEINDPEGEQNGQPYYRLSVAGPKWTTAAEPYGRSYGLYRLIETDMVSGQTQVVDIPRDLNLTGPAQSIGYVHAAFPMYNWAATHKNSDGDGTSRDTTSGNIVSLEPRPVFNASGQIDWLVSVSTTDSKGVKSNCFVNAKSNTVTAANTDAESAWYVTHGEAQVTAEANPGNLKTGSAPATSNGPLDRSAELARVKQLLNEALQRLDRLEAGSQTTPATPTQQNPAPSAPTR